MASVVSPVMVLSIGLGPVRQRSCGGVCVSVFVYMQLPEMKVRNLDIGSWPSDHEILSQMPCPSNGSNYNDVASFEILRIVIGILL